MTRSLLLGSLLGLFSGVVPGPYSALVATAALEGGFWAGFRLAVLPLVTEGTIMAAAALALTQLPETTLRYMGVAGGCLVLFMAVRTWRRSRDLENGSRGGAKRTFAAGLTFAVVSPAPWVFWFLVGAPLFLDASRAGWGSAAAFLGSFVFCLSGVHVALTALAAYGHKRLPLHWRRRLLGVTAAVLVLAGAGLVWQSWVGNFERMVTGSEEIRTLVPDSLY